MSLGFCLLVTPLGIDLEACLAPSSKDLLLALSEAIPSFSTNILLTCTLRLLVAS